MNATGSAGTGEAASTRHATIGTDGSSTADGIATGTGDGDAAGCAAARTFDRTTVYIEIIAAKLPVAAEIVQPFVRRHAEKVIECALTGGRESVAAEALSASRIKTAEAALIKSAAAEAAAVHISQSRPSEATHSATIKTTAAAKSAAP